MYFHHLFQASVKYVQNNDKSLRKDQNNLSLCETKRLFSVGPQGGLGIPQARLPNLFNLGESDTSLLSFIKTGSQINR